MIYKGHKWAVLMLSASLALAGCSKEDLQEMATEQTGQGGNSSEVKDGYFTATLLPGMSGVASRAALNEPSDAVQSLRFWIFKKDDADGGKYKYFDPKSNNLSEAVEEEIFNHKSDGFTQSEEWPLKRTVQLTLPMGEYKVVFVGNYDPEQFEGQNGKPLVSFHNDIKTYDNMRINMPEAGPKAFHGRNMFYLATADFSAVNPNPYILLQRVVAQSTFTRDLIRTDDAVGKLVESLVQQISEGQLTHDLLDGLLTSTLLKPVEELLKALHLDLLLDMVTTIVDRLVNVLLGDLITLLDKALLKYVTDLVNQVLQANLGAATDILLNPWTNVDKATVTATLPAMIDMNRVGWGTREWNYEYTFPQIEKGKPRNVVLTSLNGDFTLKSITVDKNGLLGNLVGNVDDKLLDGLLVNITTPIAYNQESNLSYSTTYDFLNLNLKSDEEVSVDLGTILDKTGNSLTDIIDVGRLSEAILGDGLLSLLLGKVSDELLAPLVEALTSTLTGLKITLPNLELGTISADGRWGATTNSLGVVIPTQTGDAAESK